MDLQKLVDVMNESSRKTRGRYQMTLGKMVDILKGSDPTLPVIFGGADTGSPGDEDSYRGYYSDLSFGRTDIEVTVASFLEQCSKALGGTYEGYKGGDFNMAADTPIWCAAYGCCGNAIMEAIQSDGKLILVTRDVEAD
jgi:hypothetical protein